MLLKEFFDENHYHFTHSFAFDPVLNDGLRKALEQMPAPVSYTHLRPFFLLAMILGALENTVTELSF